MQQLLQHLMGSPTAFNKLEFTSVVVVAVVAGMVIGGLAGTTRRATGVPHGYTISSRGAAGSRMRRTARSNADGAFGVGSGAVSSYLAGVGLRGASRGSGQWVNLNAAANYQHGAFPQPPSHIPAQTLPPTMLPTAMLPLAALPSAASPVSIVAPQSPPFMVAPQSPASLLAPQSPASFVAPQSPGSLVAPQSPAFLLVAPQSPATPLVVPSSGGPPLVELQPVAFLPGIYQATTYRLDVTGRLDADPAGKIRPLWRLGNALFSAARGKTAWAITPPAESSIPEGARPGRHRASRSKRIRRNDKWMRDW